MNSGNQGGAIMKRTRTSVMVLACIAAAAIAPVAHAQFPSGSDVVGVYFEVDGEYTNDPPTSLGGSVYAHILITNPSQQAMEGYEYEVVIPPGAVMISQWILPSGSINIFAPPEMMVGSGVPVPAENDMILTATMHVFVLSTSPGYFYLQPLELSAPYPLYVGTYPEVVELEVSSGRYDLPVAVVNSGYMPAPVCSVEPTDLDFGEVDLGESSDRTVQVTNTGGGILSLQLAEDGDEFSILNGSDHYYLGQDDTVDVQVRYTPTEAGYHTCTLDVAAAGCGPIHCTGRTRFPFLDVTSDPLGDESDGLGVAWGDYDNDGRLDLYLANWSYAANVLFHNEGDDEFTEVAGDPPCDTGRGTGVAWGDVDNDGDLDLYLANTGPENKLFRNDGAGSFVDATSVVLNDTRNGTGVAWSDYDNDGDLDLYLANQNVANKLFRNEGDGTFADATSGPLGDTGNGQGIAWGDYDSDGDPDLYLANYGGANKLFRNDGGGTFVDATGGPLGETGNSFGVAWGDYDNDGDLDLYIANESTSNKLLRNDGSGSFFDATSPPLDDAGSGRGVAWGDYDNDGHLDLYLVNNDGANKLFRNSGSGTFTDATDGAVGDAGSGTGAAWGDYDNDGDLDLYLVNFGSSNKLLRNEIGEGGHWLQIRLEGTGSNRAGIGARVRLVAGDGQQIREISGGSGYLSQDAVVASFGLGPVTVVDTIQIHWPQWLPEGGVHETLMTDVAVDQLLIVQEPVVPVSGVVPEESAPSVYMLHPCVPNPFNPMTTIRFDLPQTSRVSLRVYDLAGRLVRTLVDGESMPAGRREILWYGRNGSGQQVATGVYFCRLDAGSFRKTVRMTMVK